MVIQWKHRNFLHLHFRLTPKKRGTGEKTGAVTIWNGLFSFKLLKLYPFLMCETDILYLWRVPLGAERSESCRERSELALCASTEWRDKLVCRGMRESSTKGGGQLADRLTQVQPKSNDERMTNGIYSMRIERMWGKLVCRYKTGRQLEWVYEWELESRRIRHQDRLAGRLQSLLCLLNHEERMNEDDLSSEWMSDRNNTPNSVLVLFPKELTRPTSVC